MKLLVVAGAIGALALPASPAFAAGSFSCRASASRAATAAPVPSVTSEPVVANAPGNPCSADSQATVDASAGPVTAKAVRAETTAGTSGVSAFAQATLPTVSLPGLVVSVESLTASATAACGGAISSASRVAGLIVNGMAIALPPGDAPFTLPLGPLGSIDLNQETKAGSTITRRAVSITTPVATVVLGEAIAAVTGDPCTGANGAPTPPGGGGNGGGGGGNGGAAGSGDSAVKPCPPGADYDRARNLCVIHDGSTTIIVGRPFEGPSGGSVVSLRKAKLKFKSACLSGKGSKYVIYGTNKRDSITGTNHSDRILLLAGSDRAEGGRGDDCIDGGTGGDTLSGALGKDRLIGGKGNDHLVGGSQADVLSAGAGNDTINSGFGRDRVSGGAGADAINVATAGPAVKKLDCGAGRDKVRYNRNERRIVRNCEVQHSIR